MSDPGWHRPANAAEAVALRRALGPTARYFAGGTALQLGWPDGRADHPVIDLGRLPSGPDVVMAQDRLTISAFARLEDLRRDGIVAEQLPALGRAIASVGAVGVRHLATLGGNVAWGPGDLVPLFLVLDALVVGAESGRRPLADRLVAPGDDLLVAVEIPLPAPDAIRFEKVAGREAFAPGLVTVAAAIGPDGPRAAVGGGPVTPRRLDLAGLDGLPPRAVADELARRVAAPDDDHATGAWRSRVAGNLLAAFLCGVEVVR